MKQKGREKMEEVEKWVSMKYVCEYLDVTRYTVFRWIKEKEMPVRKVGGNWRFRISEIEEWIEKEQEKG